MPAKLTAEDYHRVAKEKNCEWLGELVPTTKERTPWRCHCGREWETTYGSMVKNAGNCPGCGGTEKKTEIDYFNLAESTYLTWVGPMPKDAHSKSVWECREGHQWETSYVYVNQGYGCPHCAGVIPKTPDDYHTLATERGLEWLGPEVPNVDTKTWWRCKSGHTWETIYYHIFKGYGCPVCSGNIQKTAQDYKELASSRGFMWLGPEVSSIHQRTWWQCHKGHRWQAVYASVFHQGTGCPICAGNTRRESDDYYQLAKMRGFEWLGPEVPNTSTKTGWMCPDGHKWQAVYTSVALGTGCPHCAGVARKTPDDYRQLAQKKGVEWLGPEVSNSTTKTRWRCPEGHEWETTFSWLSGCPHCDSYEFIKGQRVSRPQLSLFDMLKHYPKAEMNTKYGRFTLDISMMIGDLNICVEYDSWYWHKDKLKRDARRDRDLIRDGWQVLRVKSGTQLPTQAQLDAALAELVEGAKYAEIVLVDWGEP